MSFFNRLDLFIKENTFNARDYQYTKNVINEYLRKKNITWDNLTLNMQEILIAFEKIENISGLVPKDAQLHPHLFL